MRQSEKPEDRVWLELSDTAPRNITRLLLRLAVRDDEITGKRAQAMLEAVGIRTSVMTCNSVISETRTVLRYLESKNLLSEDFERRRTHTASDFVTRYRRKRRRRE